MTFLERLDRATRITALVVVLVVIATTTYALWPDPPKKRLTASFPATVGLYVGSDVRVLGVPIGTVEEVVPEGTSVRVEMAYEARYDIPADASAVIVAPSIVSDRYVQLTPVYRGGPVMADGARIALDRSAVPVELDRIYGSLDQLAVALGPEGANRDGALSRLLETGAKNLDGQGAKLHSTVKDAADALDTLSKGRHDLFATVRQLERFTRALAENDEQVRAFNADLEKVAAQLSGEREDLARALHELALALTDIARFVRENRDELRSNVEGLTALSKTLVKQQKALREVLEVGPVALANLDKAYNPVSGTLDTRNNFAQLDDPGLYLCSVLAQLGQPEEACEGLRDVLDGLPKLPEIPGGPARAAPDESTGGATGRPGRTTSDPTLGGILVEDGDR
ncbi:MAG TPA: MCE family protein [Actinopolymorphaceae bacterium]